ncbi:hypothetical protein ACFLXB_06765 [Chloroflexota bacterium]
MTQIKFNDPDNYSTKGDSMQIKRYLRSCFFVITITMVFLSACSPPVAVNTPTMKVSVSTQTPAILSSPTSTVIVQTVSTPAALTEVQNPQLSKLDMLDTMNGWGTTESKLVKTMDGGTSWYDITPPWVQSLGHFNSFFFLNSLKGWVLTPADDPGEGDLAFTGDGGLNWERLPVPFDNGEIKFIDPNIGFILVGRGVAAGSSAVDIYSTVDGGRNWIAVYQMQPGLGDEINSLPFSGQKNGLGVLDAMNIWVSGSIPMESYVYLYNSRDGGYTWEKQEVLLPEPYGSSMTEVMPPQFFENGYGILPIRLYGTNTEYAFYLSDDGGLSWSPGEPLISNGKISIISPTEFLVWDGGPLLHFSEDGGSTWSSIVTNMNSRDQLINIDFVSLNVGWILTGDSSGRSDLIKTMDGGRTWNSLIP